MQFFTPWGFLALLAVPLIILFYILKRKYKEKEIPSLYLWKKALPESMAQEPWQKLRKNLLLLLQLIIATLLALALAGPYYMGKTQVVDYVLALDASMSMQAVDGEGTRFETAKKEMQKLVEDASPQSTFSVVLLSDRPELLLSGAKEKQRILQKMQEMEVTFGGVDWVSAEALLQGEQEVLGGEIILFTDDYGRLEQLSPIERIYGKSVDNTALTLLSHTVQEEGLSVLTRVESKGAGGEKTVTLYADGMVFDTKTVDLEDEESLDLVFLGVPAETQSLMARVFPEDSLAADDVLYEGVAATTKHKVLLVTEGNVFLEKAFSLMDQIELYKTTPDHLDGVEGYGLYILDGCSPEGLPDTGAVWLFHPPVGGDYGVSNEEKPIAATVRTATETGLPDVESVAFALEKGRPIATRWGKSLLKAEEDTLAVFGELNGRKTAVFSFDIRDSDLPLTAGFPILLYRMLEWYFPASAVELEQGTAGQSMRFALRPETAEAFVTTPENKEFAIAPPFPPQPFIETAVPGMYFLTEKSADGGVMSQSFGVNGANGTESDLRQSPGAAGETKQETKTVSAGKSLRNWGLLLVLLLLLTEWRVNCREH